MVMAWWEILLLIIGWLVGVVIPSWLMESGFWDGVPY